MTLFETYHVHILKPVALSWTDRQYELGSKAVEDSELCGLLELVTHLYLRQRAADVPLAADLVVGVRHHYDHELTGYVRPFQSDTLDELLPLLRRMVADLEHSSAVREIDADKAARLRKAVEAGEAVT